jgi:hypothetical protein
MAKADRRVAIARRIAEKMLGSTGNGPPAGSPRAWHAEICVNCGHRWAHVFDGSALRVDSANVYECMEDNCECRAYSPLSVGGSDA